MQLEERGSNFSIKRLFISQLALQQLIY